jgi:hypothetical protein
MEGRRRKVGWWAVGGALAVLATSAAVALPVVDGGGHREQAKKPTLTSLAKQVSALRSQDVRLRRRISALARTPGPQGPQGLQGIQGVQGIQGPVGAHLVRATRTLPDGGGVTTLVTLPGLGSITTACANGATTAQVFFTPSGPGQVDFYQQQIRAASVVATGSRLSPGGGSGFVQVALPWQWTVQLAGTAGDTPAQASVAVAAVPVPGPACGVSAFGWATD